MTASRSGLGPASGGDALESVTGKDRSNNDVKQPLTRLVVNFYRTVVAQAKKGGSRRHGAKALDVDVAVVKGGEDQEQLAALAPLIRRFAPPSPVNGRRALVLRKTSNLESQPAPHHLPRLVHPLLLLSRERLHAHPVARPEQHTPELTSLMTTSFAISSK